MKAKMLLLLVTSIALILLAQVPAAFSKQKIQAFKDDRALDRFQAALKQDGFDVSTGSVEMQDMAAEYCEEKADSAFYYNNQPYLRLLIPQPGDQPDTEFFQLAPDEAVVLIGMTPPPAKYFSYSPYLRQKDYFGESKCVSASLGDAVNNATVKTIGSTPFNSPVALIFTPDQGTDAHVRAALRRAGYPAAIINTIVFPASMLALGYKETDDLLGIVVRNAFWLNKADGDHYLHHPPLSVFRVTPRTPAIANPFPAPPLRIRGTGRTEMGLTKKLDDLREGIIEDNPGLDAKDIVLNPMCNEGYDLVQRGIELCGDSRDAFYLGAGLPEWDEVNRITLADGEFLMLYGVNHVATRKATYMNINVYASDEAKLTLVAIDDSLFPGTAKPYLDDGDPDADLMYAYKISRSCEQGEASCLQLSAPEDCTRLTIDANTLLGIFTRIYLEPATKVGPAMPEMLYERVIKFSPTPPSP